MDLRPLIRTIPDFPREGVMFRDITTLFAHGAGFAHAVDGMTAPFADSAIDVVAAIEARGFIPGGAVARQLQAAFVAIRKKGKLPRRAIGEDYELEYGIDRIEIHDDAVREGARVLVVDDLIATGGTARAAVRLLRRANADIVGASFVIDLPALGGADRVRQLGVPCHSLVSF